MKDFTKQVCSRIGNRDSLNKKESDFVTDWLFYWLKPENERKNITDFMNEKNHKKYIGNINPNVLSFAKYCFDSVPLIRKSFFDPMTVEEIVDFIFDSKQRVFHLGFDMIYHLSVNESGCCYFSASKIISNKFIAFVKPETPSGIVYKFYAFDKDGKIYFPPFMKKEEGFCK